MPSTNQRAARLLLTRSNMHRCPVQGSRWYRKKLEKAEDELTPQAVNFIDFWHTHDETGGEHRARWIRDNAAALPRTTC